MEKNFHGPFFRTSETDRWHWIKNCPDFPHAQNPQAMITSSLPEANKLCKKCTELEISNSNGKSVLMKTAI